MALPLCLRDGLVLPDHRLLRLQGRMHGIVGEIEEEWLLSVFVNEVHGLVGKPVGQVFSGFAAGKDLPACLQFGRGDGPASFVRVEVVARVAVVVGGDGDVEAMVASRVEWFPA